MIIGNIDNLKETAFGAVIERVLALNPLALTSGIHKLDGDDLFINRVSGETRLVEDSQSEIHKQYFDIHLVLEGAENVGFAIPKASTDFMAESTFNNDCELVSDVAGEQFVTLSVGEFFVIEPGIWHRPMIAVGGVAPIEKVVIKINKEAI
ncbi:YhcH/YjgK/YiaL family protein [Enterovibrio sp. ZSDZ35]|uniref:YhcH/YjgK/YiaL family protein n=1 Tax=Enterovibrio qingdaonensis TaxID=2899818 RepID=A0ABT5QJ12_9GAMM|nr:YhcH/YjgK/YiaL family protein [Enterovibrio sp. ZSDZ35]MDD1780980.1 YhcH/YjgK/YiaL family protein [Enterovibrio sp. ZSDZ35]